MNEHQLKVLQHMQSQNWRVLTRLLHHGRHEGWVFYRKDRGPLTVLTHYRQAKNKYCFSKVQYDRYAEWDSLVYIAFDGGTMIRMQDMVIRKGDKVINLFPGRDVGHDPNYQVPLHHPAILPAGLVTT